MLLRNILLALSTLSFAMSANYALAGAYTSGEYKYDLSIDLLYDFGYKFNQTGSEDDGIGNILDYNITNKLSDAGLGFDLEYGLTNHISLLGEIEMYRYDDKISIASGVNSVANPTLSFSTNYYDISPSAGIKHMFYKSDIDALAYEVRGHAGNFLVGKHSNHYIGRSAAASLTLLYDVNFDLPFGFDTKPKYGHYFSLEGGYKFYPKESHNEFTLNASVGIKPFNDKISLIAGLYNTFNGFSYTKRPYSVAALNNGIDSLGLNAAHNSILKAATAETLVSSGISHYHQLGFQVAYDITDSKTIYLKTYHNVFRDKPFTFNSVYLTLDLKY